MNSDWIETYLDITSEVRSPHSFKLWTGIGIIASVLDQKVGMLTDAPQILRPNLYTFLTGVPATGKGLAIGVARQLLGSIPELRLAPDNPTKRTFLNHLQDSVFTVNGYEPKCSMTALIPELGVLISKYEKDFVADLTHIFDNPPKYTAPRQTSEDVDIDSPILNILAGVTPGALGDTIPETAWDQGFTSRIMFIYGAPIDAWRNIFKRKTQTLDLTLLEKDLNYWFYELHGIFDWDEDAQEAWNKWFNVDKMAPKPNYGKLISYNGRRDIFSLKLAMISAVSAGHELNVKLSDWERGLKWLLDAEADMPNVFRAMVQRNDIQLLKDMHHWANNKYERTKELISHTEIYEWFARKVPSERINQLINTAEKMSYIFRPNGQGFGYKPNTPEFVERHGEE